jgi:hypothetical protein
MLRASHFANQEQNRLANFGQNFYPYYFLKTHYRQKISPVLPIASPKFSLLLAFLLKPQP